MLSGNGIIGTGLLAIPVLAGSAAYAVGEALRWHTGLERKPREAAGFYGVLAAAMLFGLGRTFTAVDPIWGVVLAGGRQRGDRGAHHDRDDAHGQ